MKRIDYFVYNSGEYSDTGADYGLKKSVSMNVERTLIIHLEALLGRAKETLWQPYIRDSKANPGKTCFNVNGEEHNHAILLAPFGQNHYVAGLIRPDRDKEKQGARDNIAVLGLLFSRSDSVDESFWHAIFAVFFDDTNNYNLALPEDNKQRPQFLDSSSLPEQLSTTTQKMLELYRKNLPDHVPDIPVIIFPDHTIKVEMPTKHPSKEIVSKTVLPKKKIIGAILVVILMWFSADFLAKQKSQPEIKIEQSEKELEQTIAKLRTEVSDLKGKLETLERENSRLNKEIKSLHDEARTAKISHQQAEESIAVHKLAECFKGFMIKHESSKVRVDSELRFAFPKDGLYTGKEDILQAFTNAFLDSIKKEVNND